MLTVIDMSASVKHMLTSVYVSGTIYVWKTKKSHVKLRRGRRKNIVGNAYSVASTESSIPRKGITVNRLMNDLFVGMPFTTREFGITNIPETFSVSELDVSLSRLDRTEGQFRVRSKFMRGAFGSWLHDPCHSVIRAIWLAHNRKVMPDEKLRRRYLHNLSECGKVHDRWPIEKRSDDYSWNYYCTHDKDGKLLEQPTEENMPHFKVEDHWIRKGYANLRCMGYQNKLVAVEITTEQVDALFVDLHKDDEVTE